MKIKDNEITFIENNQIVKYRIVLKIDGNDKTYLVYTNDEKNDKDEVILYVGVLSLNKDGSEKIISIKDDKEWKYIRDIINSFEIGENKNGK